MIPKPITCGVTLRLERLELERLEKDGEKMSESYVECLVKQKAGLLKTFLRYLLMMLTVVLVMSSFLMGMNFILFLLGLAVGVAAYFTYLYTDLEYEYLYLDRELTVDKVMAKTKRARVAVYQMDRIEVLAPIGSYHLDEYRNRSVKVKDYSVGYEDKPDQRYCMYYEGGEKLILSPSPEMVKAMKNVAPRKIFSE